MKVQTLLLPWININTPNNIYNEWSNWKHFCIFSRSIMGFLRPRRWVQNVQSVCIWLLLHHYCYFHIPSRTAVNPAIDPVNKLNFFPSDQYKSVLSRPYIPKLSLSRNNYGFWITWEFNEHRNLKKSLR